MAVASGTTPAILSLAVGLALSLAIESLLAPRPQPFWRRPLAALSLHAGLWLGLFALFVLLVGRPWFALAVQAAILLLVVLVSNAKMAALREPFVFQDYEYFTDALAHPRLYLPFLGWFKAAVGAGGFALAILAGLWLETPPVDRWAGQGQLGAIAAIGIAAAALLWFGDGVRQRVSFDPPGDLRGFGLLASLWCYARAEREVADLSSSFTSWATPAGGPLPDLVAVQSESFFDARLHFPGVRQDVLAEFDAVKAEAALHGRLSVSAWGANTVRSEFAFLTGIPEPSLGVHRFNPYRRLPALGLPTLASHLRALGYRTICVHPYPASFYRRHRVFPQLGFDAFIDIEQFAAADRCGPYVGDAAVARKVAEILERERGPVFVFAITMENHGPLHLEAVTAADEAALYERPPPPGCEDLTVYLRHLRNADRMLATLRATLEARPRPASLCWFGDHVPIMAKVYRELGAPDGRTEYLVWRNDELPSRPARELGVHQLANEWLQAALDAKIA